MSDPKKPSILDPGDLEAIERLRGAPTESPGDRSTRQIRVFGGILLILLLVGFLVWMGMTIYGSLHKVTGGYEKAVQDSMLPAPDPGVAQLFPRISARDAILA